MTSVKVPITGYEVVARGDDDSSSSSESETEEHENDDVKERRARDKLQRERDEERKRIKAGEFIPEEGDIENKNLNKVRIASTRSNVNVISEKMHFSQATQPANTRMTSTSRARAPMSMSPITAQRIKYARK